MIFWIFFFLILSLIVEVYLWWKLQASLIFLSGRTCTIGGWLNTFLPHCIYTGQFIRYTLPVPGWTPFAFRTALILCGIDSTRCWKHSSELLVHIDMIASRSCCRFVGCTSMMWISHSTTLQRCSIGLRSGDCGGHLSKVNSLSCSRNQSEMIWDLWHGALSCWN